MSTSSSSSTNNKRKLDQTSSSNQQQPSKRQALQEIVNGRRIEQNIVSSSQNRENLSNLENQNEGNSHTFDEIIDNNNNGYEVSDIYFGPLAAEQGHCEHYLEDMYQCLLSAEERGRDYLRGFQSDINDKMRHILMDWIVDVADQYNVSSKALFLAKKIIDVILGRLIFARNQLQLLGVVALLISSKFEDVQFPSINELVYISANSCNVAQIKEMEVLVLNRLFYRLTIPTEMDFLPRFISTACYYQLHDVTQRVTHLANYFSEVTLLYYPFIRFKSSIIAAVSVCLALAVCSLELWTPHMQQHFPALSLEYSNCMASLLEHLRTIEDDSSVKKKYAQENFGRVSVLPIPDDVPFFSARSIMAYTRTL